MTDAVAYFASSPVDNLPPGNYPVKLNTAVDGGVWVVEVAGWRPQNTRSISRLTGLATLIEVNAGGAWDLAEWQRRLGFRNPNH